MSMRPFEQIVTEYGPMVLRVARAVAGPADAEDAWSETFLAALKAYPLLAPGANVEAWLVTIAHGNWRSTSPAGARPSTCRWTSGWPGGSAAACSRT